MMVAAVCLCPGLVSAQAIDRPSSPVSPPRPSTAFPLVSSQLPPLMGQPDVFLAPPGAYAPRLDRVNPRRHNRHDLGYPYASGGYASFAYGPSAEQPRPREVPVGVLRLEVAPLPERAPAAPSAPMPVPGKPKTFYVIPGCYAGDRRPDRNRLPANCDLRRLRIVPPA